LIAVIDIRLQAEEANLRAYNFRAFDPKKQSSWQIWFKYDRSRGTEKIFLLKL
jgi:hypothetical protein